MPRPPKERRITYIPKVKYFKPAGIPMRDLQEVVLTMEEVEAIRLKDRENMSQEEAAQEMQVSRATFQRILIEARNKISEALIAGKAIRFEGGDYRLAKRYRCGQCKEEFADGEKIQEETCPECGSPLHEGGLPEDQSS